MSALPIKTDTGCCAPGCCDDGENTAVSTAANISTSTPASGEELTSTVQEKYGAAARRVLESLETSETAGATCCGPVNSCCGAAAFDGATDPITSNLYVTGEIGELPEAAVLATLGC